MALIPPEDTNWALAWPDCQTAPSKSEGKQLRVDMKWNQWVLYIVFGSLNILKQESNKQDKPDKQYYLIHTKECSLPFSHG